MENGGGGVIRFPEPSVARPPTLTSVALLSLLVICSSAISNDQGVWRDGRGQLGMLAWLFPDVRTATSCPEN